MSFVYVVKYICEDSNPEILGVYTSKQESIEELLIRANYREKNGILTQYKYYTDEYPSLEYLKNLVDHQMFLEDGDDIYKIEKVPFNEKSKERLIAGE